jgi:enediyne biosynthesis protein E4
VAFGDVNRDGLLDVVIGQHFKQPWVKPVANRLYLNQGIKNGVPSFEDVTESVGLVPLPMKGPHVEIQDFDNDGWPDIFTSIVKFANQRPHPVIFKHLGIQKDRPQFKTDALAVNDFPTAEDKASTRTGEFFEKMLGERKIFYSAPGPSGDYNNDGRLDLFLPSWWKNSPSMLLHNETTGGHWLDVRVEGGKGVNRQGVGTRINLYSVNQLGERQTLLGSREISVGFGYASGQPAIAHFGLGDIKVVDVEAILPHGQGTITRREVPADQRLTLSL